MDRPYPHLAIDEQLCLPLYAASRAVTRRYNELLVDLGLTYPQYLCLLALWDANGDSLTVSELGRQLHLDSGTLTPVLKRLAANGLVDRTRDESDERRVLLTATDRAWELRDQASAVRTRLTDGLTMTADEGRVLRALLEQVISEMEDPSARA